MQMLLVNAKKIHLRTDNFKVTHPTYVKDSKKRYRNHVQPLWIIQSIWNETIPYQICSDKKLVAHAAHTTIFTLNTTPPVHPPVSLSVAFSKQIWWLHDGIWRVWRSAHTMTHLQPHHSPHPSFVFLSLRKRIWWLYDGLEHSRRSSFWRRRNS